MKTNYETPFICYDKTPIIFGKLKGQPHSVLQNPENLNYCKWILSLEDDFGKATKEYIMKNVKLQ